MSLEDHITLDFSMLKYSCHFLCSHIFNTPVTDPAYMEQLKILDQKSRYLKEHKFKGDNPNSLLIEAQCEIYHNFNQVFFSWVHYALLPN